jgi:pimeloyl-ACP methyl ester carboxylesterase
MPELSCNGVTLHYAVTGQGPPLVFLNGLAGDHLYWMGQVRAFTREFHCLALDNRDAGQSSYATQPYTIADLAEDVACFLQTLNQPPAHIVGLSLGGMIAQELAIRHPERVQSLFLTGTLVHADEWFIAMLNAFSLIRHQVADSRAFFVAVLPWLVSQRFFEIPERVEWLRGLLQQNPYPQQLDGFCRQFEAIRQHQTLTRLSAIQCPVLVATGEDDLIAPPRYARQLVEKLPQARLELLPGVGHAPPIEAPRLFNQVLRTFLLGEATRKGELRIDP